MEAPKAPKLIRVTITVEEAKNLPNMDTWTVSDPYVVIMHDGRKVGQTKVIDDDLNPKFNFQCVCEADPNKNFNFHVWDKDVGTADDSLGSLDMDCKNFGSESGEWVPIQRGKGPKGGKISEKDAQLKLKIELPPPPRQPPPRQASGTKDEPCCGEGCSVM